MLRMQFLDENLSTLEDKLSLTLIGDWTLYDVLAPFVLFLVLLVAFKIFKLIILKNLKRLSRRSKTGFDDTVIDAIQDIPEFFYYILALYFPLKLVLTNPTGLQLLKGVFLVVVVLQGIRIADKVLLYLIKTFALKKDDEGNIEAQTTYYALNLIVKIGLWSVGILLVLSNLGFDITTLVASLGIGGVAVALAVQNILSDVFSSFSIYFDKPFEVGDFIIVGNEMGTVQRIGLKTTRLLALQGEELVISNHELTSSRIQNFKKMQKRRVVMQLGVVYDTGLKDLKKVNEIVEKVLDKVENADLDRVHFMEFGDFALKFEIVFYVLTGDYAKYMDTQQEILFGIKEQFEKAKVEMAFPTQTVYVEK